MTHIMKRYLFFLMALASSVAMLAQTRNLVIEETNGKFTYIPTDDVAGILFEEAPPYQEAPYLLASTYGIKDGFGNYMLYLATAQPNSDGSIKDRRDVQVQLVLVGPQSDDKYNARIPAGYYAVGNSSKEFSFDVAQTAVLVWVEDPTTTGNMDMISNGGVDVRVKDDGSYDIRLELMALSGNEYNLRYEGDVAFSLDASAYDEFPADASTTFTQAQGRFYGNWYNHFTHDILMQFYNGVIQNGMQKSGYFFNLPLQMPLVDDPMNKTQKVADGVYTVDAREKSPYYAYKPFSYVSGREIDLFGTKAYSGSYITCLTEEGRRYIGLIVDGTITVSGGGTQFVFDLELENGKKLTATYSGNPLITNYCDNETQELKRPYSLLEADHVISKWSDDTLAYTYNEGNSIHPDLDTWVTVIGHYQNAKGDYVQMYILTEPGKGIEPGTYPIGASLAPGSVVFGCTDYGGNMLFSWYGDLDSTDADGYQSVLAPLYEGTVTISKDAEGKFTFVFDMKDDKGYKMTGQYTGLLFDITDDVNGVSELQSRSKKFSNRGFYRMPRRR